MALSLNPWDRYVVLHSWKFNGGDVGEAVRCLAEEGCASAYVWVEHDANAGEGEEALFHAWNACLTGFPAIAAAERVMWRRIHLAVRGDRAVLVRSAKRVLDELDGAFGLGLRLVLVEILEGDSKAAFDCDPGGELDAAGGTLGAWVRPYGSHLDPNTNRPVVTRFRV